MEKRQEVNQNGSKKLGNKGFSLVELIVVIAIMAILTVVIAPQFMRYIEKSRESVDIQTVDSITSSIEAALADEKAWDSFGTAAVTVNFKNAGGTISTDATGKVTAATDREYSANAGAAFIEELNQNLNKVVSFKAKKNKQGITFTINPLTKEIKTSINGTPVVPET